MDHLFNQYSLLITASLLVIAIALLLYRRDSRIKTSDLVALGVLVLALGFGWWLIHPVQTVLSEDARDVTAMIGQGQPVLLEFQSPYCISCTVIKPTIDGLAKEFQGRLLIIRLNVQEPVGRELAPVYMFEYTPTFIFFDAGGSELWRQIGGLDPARVRESMK
jgi:thiol-disulfide isomerase/thioredoxin